jgi:hypothetical protein
MIINKAQRKAVKIKLAITGPSGAGKTMSALLLAKGLIDEGRILVIDSEDGSSNLYADHEITKGIDFDVLELDAPYTIQKYIQALELGQKEGYDIIIIDSISHAWAGEGGLLDKKTSLDARGGNSFTNWASITKEQELFKSKIVHSSCHVIVTMRSKQEHVIEINDKGRSAPKKVGMAAIQRDGMEYEFTTVFDTAMDHSFSVSKDRTGLFDGCIEKMSIATGERIRKWLDGAPPQVQKVGAVKSEPAQTSETVSYIYNNLVSFHADNDIQNAYLFIKDMKEDDKKQLGRILKEKSPEMLEWIKKISANPPNVEGSERIVKGAEYLRV